MPIAVLECLGRDTVEAMVVMAEKQGRGGAARPLLYGNETALDRASCWQIASAMGWMSWRAGSIAA